MVGGLSFGYGDLVDIAKAMLNISIDLQERIDPFVRPFTFDISSKFHNWVRCVPSEQRHWADEFSEFADLMELDR